MDKSALYNALIENILIKEGKYRDPNFSAQVLAGLLGVSASKLSRVIKNEYGMTYTNLVHNLRIQDAKRYLKNVRMSAYSIEDIGTFAGFKNRQSFFNAFRKATGTTPERFRRTKGNTESPSIQYAKEFQTFEQQNIRITKNE
jgi:AraC-like DNA-binding protein